MIMFKKRKEIDLNPLKIILSPVKMMLAKMSRAALRGEAVKGALDSFIMTAGCPRPVMRVKVSHIHDFAFLGHS